MFSKLLCASLLALFAVSADACVLYSPYIGVDLQHHSMNFAPAKGDIYVGAKITENVAVELGYEATTFHKAGSPMIISRADYKSPAVIGYDYRLQGLHLDAVLATLLRENSKWKALFTAGMVHLKGSLKVHTLFNEMNSGIDIQSTKHKTVFRFSTGLQYQLTNNISLRGTIGFLNVNRLGIKPCAASFGKEVGEYRPKSVPFYSIGLNINL